MNSTYQTQDPRASIARELARFYSELSGSAAKPAPKFSLSRVLQEMRSERGLHDGYEREVTGAAATISGGTFDPHRVIVPWAALATRDFSQSNGGYLVADRLGDPIDVLRPFSVVAEAGVTTLTGLRENLILPRVTATPTAAWVAEDGVSQYSESQPTIGTVSLTPKVAAVLLDFSHQFQRQAASLEMLLRQQLLGAVGALFDQAFFAGTGNSGQPMGLVGTANVGTQSGTSMDYADILAMRMAVLSAGGREENLSWVGPPGVQEILGQVERITGAGRFCWDDDGILGRPAHATETAPARTLIVGDFSKAIVALWGAGIKVEINPYAAFNTGKLSARVVLDVDIAFPLPTAFCVASSIT